MKKLTCGQKSLIERLVGQEARLKDENPKRVRPHVNKSFTDGCSIDVNRTKRQIYDSFEGYFDETPVKMYMTWFAKKQKELAGGVNPSFGLLLQYLESGNYDFDFSN